MPSTHRACHDHFYRTGKNILFLHLDCNHYLGDRPCIFDRLCEGCPHYSPMGPRILIVKLGMLGDVVRTGCLVSGLNQLVGEKPHVTWLTHPDAVDLVERIPGIDRAVPFSNEGLLSILSEQFSLVISLDKEPAPCSVAMKVRSKKRLGIGLSRYGTPYPINKECDHYFRLGLDDHEKFRRNRNSMPQLIYEALGMNYQGETYTLQVTVEDMRDAAICLQESGAPDNGVLIGINPGAGTIYAHKSWREDGYVDLICRLTRERDDVHIVMLGGAAEEQILEKIIREVCQVGADKKRIHHPGSDLPLGVSAAVIAQCKVVVSADTLAMHLAIAQKRHVVAIFGPTCEQEIDLFGRGEKVISPIECSPCYLKKCDKSPHCQDLITNESVANAVIRQLEAASLAEVIVEPR